MKKKKAIIIISTIIITICILATIVITFVTNFVAFKVEGRSMEPTLKAGQYIIVRKNSEVKKGDIIVTNKNIKLIKRVTAVEGDIVDGTVIPENQVYVLGDNLSISRDSREFGPIDTNMIIGKVVWPK